MIWEKEDNHTMMNAVQLEVITNNPQTNGIASEYIREQES